MTDLAIRVLDDGTLDLSVCCNDLETTEGLESAVVISLFTDARVPDDYALPDGAYRGGSWMDSFPDIDGDEMGSLLWLLTRAKQTTGNLQDAERYATKALQWMLDDGVAKQATIAASYPLDGVLGLAIAVTDKRGRVLRFSYGLDQSGSLCKCPPLWPYEPTIPGGSVNPDFIVGT